MGRCGAFPQSSKVNKYVVQLCQQTGVGLAGDVLGRRIGLCRDKKNRP